MKIENYIDAYDLKARVAPALIAMFPIVFVAWLWFPGIQTWLNATAGLVFLYVAGWLVGRVAREEGLKVQDKFFKSEGGNLAAKLLRHSDTYLNSLDKARYKKILEKNIEELEFPSNEEEENRDPDEAKLKYEMAINWLRRKTRDEEKFSLVLKENINFGFHRNLLGLKAISIMSYILAMAINFAYAYAFFTPKFSDIPNINIVVGSILILAAAIVIWTFYINMKMVRSSAIAYSERLLEACEEFA